MGGNTNSEKRNVLLAVVGLTPQVVTETLYYLTQVRGVKVHEIRVVTTELGRQRVDQMLLSEPGGALWRFCQEYEIDRSSIYVAPTVVIVDSEHRPLSDIRTAADNRAAGDTIMRVVSDYTRDPNVRLFCSLAGGRKTMSTFAGFAMQLLGRPGDELLHVLVHPPQLESRPDFFYPPRSGVFVYREREGGEITISTEEISIDCAEVPFVRLRDWLPQQIDPQQRSYAELVKATQMNLDVEAMDIHLTLYARKGRTEVEVRWLGNSKTFRLTPRSASVLHFFILHAGEEIGSDAFGDGYEREVEDIYQQHYVRGTTRHYRGWDYANFRSALTRLNQELEESGLPTRIVEFCKVQSERRGGCAYYRFPLPRENCRILGYRGESLQAPPSGRPS